MQLPSWLLLDLDGTQHDRSQLQQGAFTIHSSPIPVNLLEGGAAWLRKFIIRSNELRRFFEELRSWASENIRFSPTFSVDVRAKV